MKGARILSLLLFCAFAPLSFGHASEDAGTAESLSPNDRAGGEVLPISPFVQIPGREERDGDRILLAQSTGPVSVGDGTVASRPGEIEEDADLPDPLEPMNRAFFWFNDKLYFYLLKPAAQGYKAVVPEPARVGVRNFFSNLAFPIRFVNCLLQGKVEGAANEVGRFFMNSFWGIGGLIDITKGEIPRSKEDLGQTLGVYGLGPGFYIVWPFLGPSTLRDSFGMGGDYFLNPISYLDLPESMGGRAFDTVNEGSLSIGDYEALKNAALDPYISLRSAYYQNRVSQIKK